MSKSNRMQMDTDQFPFSQTSESPLRASLRSELLTSNGKLSLKRGPGVVRALVLTGLVLDLVLEAYLIWLSTKSQPSA